MIRKLTIKQNSVMTTLLAEKSFFDTPLDDCIDIDQLLDAVPFEDTKQSFQFTLRSLRKRGYIDKAGTVIRRGKRRVVYRLSESGQKYVAR